MMAPPSALVSLFQPWADFYGDSRLVQTLVTFAHVGALLVGGGTAIAADRAALRMASDVDRRRHLLDVARAHSLVITSLVVIALSGLLLFAADVEAFWSAPIYWIKMILVALLLANGARLRAAEKAASAEPLLAPQRWSAVRSASITSLTLWIAITFAGVALINYA
jgi:uncharacterized membrane protein